VVRIRFPAESSKVVTAAVFADPAAMESPKRTVYILKNADNPPRYYTGLTANLKARLDAHNAGHCPHTSKHRPWAVDAIVKFTDEARARKLERYLKSGSGVEFADDTSGERSTRERVDEQAFQLRFGHAQAAATGPTVIVGVVVCASVRPAPSQATIASGANARTRRATTPASPPTLRRG
jgi:putative endonuclease